MTRLSGNRTKQLRRLRSKQGVVTCDRLPGRFPDSLEYRPAHRCSARKKPPTLGYVPSDRHSEWLMA